MRLPESPLNKVKILDKKMKFPFHECDVLEHYKYNDIRIWWTIWALNTTYVIYWQFTGAFFDFVNWFLFFQAIKFRNSNQNSQWLTGLIIIQPIVNFHKQKPINNPRKPFVRRKMHPLQHHYLRIPQRAPKLYNLSALRRCAQLPAAHPTPAITIKIQPETRGPRISTPSREEKKIRP